MTGIESARVPGNARDIIERSIPVTAAMLDAEIVARLLGVTAKTLANQRCAGSGLPYVKKGNFVRYPRAAVIDWLVAHMVMPKSDVAD